MDDSSQFPNPLPETQQDSSTGTQLPPWSPDPAVAPSPPPDPPWGFADLGIFVLFAALTFFLISSGAVGLYIAMHWSSSAEELMQQTPFVVLIQLLSSVVWFGFIYFTITRRYRRPFLEAVRWRPVERGLRTFFLAGIGLQIAVQAVFGVFRSRQELPIEKLFNSAGAAYLLAFLGICIAPFIEELIFRGFFYPVFEKHWGLPRAVLLTALLFAAIHAPQLGGGVPEMLAIFCVGAALSYARGRTGSLLPSYIMHVAYNSSLFLALYLGTDRFRNLPG